MELATNGCAKTCCERFYAEPEIEAHGPVVMDMLVPMGDGFYTCTNWDRETEDCLIYPERPDFCRVFPTEFSPCWVTGCQATMVPEPVPSFRKVGPL